MQISNINDVKIYNLSAGKSLPEWVSERKRRKLQNSDSELRQRVELIQDFEMPAVSSCVQVTPDGEFIYATGAYKPKSRCYDVHHMSMKFERGLDSEVTRMCILSEDYSKIVFMQCDRFIEFHNQAGRYYRTRIPKFGRDMAYYEFSCDMYFVGVSSEIYRLNLELGRFMSPLQTKATEINCCEFNTHHSLFTCGTREGCIECWDPRMKKQAGVLDCALSTHVEDLDINEVPAVTSLKCKDALKLAAGTSTGHVLLYDLRSVKPLLVKDHQYELPINSIYFHASEELVFSMDSRILKLWNEHTGKAFTSVEPGTMLNSLCVYPDSGLFFIANEAPKILVYYIPALGIAPRWCSFLDNMTEELEEDSNPTVYDDYKFVTRKELDDLGLSHLIGSSLLRAYMHGFFMDIRLYHRVRSIADPFAYGQYRKRKIREKIEKQRTNRVKIMDLPKINRNLAEKLIETDEKGIKPKKGKSLMPNLMKDDRFSAMFSNPDFQIDPESAEYKIMNPVISKMEKERQRKILQRQLLQEQFDEVEEEGRKSDEDSSSSDDERWTTEMRRQYKLARTQVMQKEVVSKREDGEKKTAAGMVSKPRFYEIKDGVQLNRLDGNKKKELKKSLADRLREKAGDGSESSSVFMVGNKEMTFSMQKSAEELEWLTERKKHEYERRKLRRSAHEITRNFKSAPKFWMGKRVK